MSVFMKNAVKKIKGCSLCKHNFKKAEAKYLVELYSKKLTLKVENESKLTSVGLLCSGCYKVYTSLIFSRKDFWVKAKGNEKGNFLFQVN